VWPHVLRLSGCEWLCHRSSHADPARPQQEKAGHSPGDEQECPEKHADGDVLASAEIIEAASRADEGHEHLDGQHHAGHDERK
jgi:hypothetical protein